MVVSLRGGVVAAGVALAFAGPLVGQESVVPGRSIALAQSTVEIWDVSGTVTLRRGSGSAVQVTATARGADGSQLRFETDEREGHGRFRVVYPDVERIAAPDGIDNLTDIRLRRDGTFDGNDYGMGRRGGDRVSVGGGRGFRGWADLEVTVPEGRRLILHLAVGRVSATGVNATVTVDTWSADATATDIAGDWLFDTGSGDATVTGMRGTLKIDTGSGTGMVSDMTGDLLDIDTGSGAAEATNVQVDRFRFDTGSGPVRARGITARRGLVDTGSGSVELAYSGGAVDDLSIDTGSGRVTLTLPPTADARVAIETGSGEVVVDRAGGVFERRDEDGMILRFGEGRGRVRIDTGSGRVTLR